MDVKSLLQSYRKLNNKESNTDVIHYCLNDLEKNANALSLFFYNLRFNAKNDKDVVERELVAPRKNKHIQHNNDITMVR